MEANEAPLVDFRVVNAVYSGSGVDFDLDITPVDLSQMPNEDTAKYLTVAVLTEDGPQTTQEIYNQPFQSIDNFDNYNVARAVGGKVLGDLVTIETAKTWPVRRHYHFAINNPDWNQDSLRIKAIAVYKGSKSYRSERSAERSSSDHAWTPDQSVELSLEDYTSDVRIRLYDQSVVCHRSKRDVRTI